MDKINKLYLHAHYYLQEERGDQLLEVALIITLIVIVAVAGLQALGVDWYRDPSGDEEEAEPVKP